MLLSFIGSGKPISDLKDPAHKIGFGWLRKKGWVTIDKGIIKPTGSAPLGKDEEMLELLSAGPKDSSELDKKGLADLKGRGLLAISKSKEWRYRKYVEATTSFNWDNTSYLPKITPEIIKNGVWEEDCVTVGGNRYKIRPYDVTLAADKIYPGKRHPYQRLIDFMVCQQAGKSIDNR